MAAKKKTAKKATVSKGDNGSFREIKDEDVNRTVRLNPVQSAKEVPLGGEDDPTLKIEGMDVIIINDIKLHRGNLINAYNDESSMNEMKTHLLAKKGHYKDVIRKMKSGEEKRFNLKRMLEVRDEINVEIRKVEDVRKNARDRIEHYNKIVKFLENRLAKEYGKSVTHEGVVLNVV